MKIDPSSLQTIDFSYYPVLANAGHVYKNVYVKDHVNRPFVNLITFNPDSGAVLINLSDYAIIPLEEYEELLDLKEQKEKGKDRGYPMYPRNI